MVTSKTKEEIKADVEQAERLGVLVICREDLIDALPRTLMQADPEGIYAEAEQAVRAGLAKVSVR